MNYIIGGDCVTR